MRLVTAEHVPLKLSIIAGPFVASGLSVMAECGVELSRAAPAYDLALILALAVVAIMFDRVFFVGLKCDAAVRRLNVLQFTYLVVGFVACSAARNSDARLRRARSFFTCSTRSRYRFTCSGWLSCGLYFAAIRR